MCKTLPNTIKLNSVTHTKDQSLCPTMYNSFAIKHHIFGLENNFLNKTSKAQATKVKNGQDCIKVKSFCIAKETAHIVKRHPVEGKKYL